MLSNYQKSTLGNGLRVIAIPMDSVQSVTVLIMVGAGSRYETKKTNGLSHFLEHMAFKGTKKRPSALQISSLIDGIGGEFNAFTSKDHTAYYIRSHIKHLPLLFDVLSDMLLNSLLQKEEIEREKGVIIEEINLYEDTPARKIGDLLENLLYGDHPLGWDISGTVENIRSMSRKDMVSYMDEYYHPNNTVITVAGGISELQNNKDKSVDGLVKKWLADWEKKPFKQSSKASDNQKKPALLVKYKKTNQAHLAIGVRTFPVGHPRRYALSVLSNILGGGMSSRLFIEVRERRGLAYYVRSGTQYYKDVGNFTTVAGVDKNRIEQAIKVIFDQYGGIRDKHLKVSDDELKKAKEYIKGRLTLELENSQAVAGLYAGQEIIEDEVKTPDEIIKKIEAVTIDDIYDVAREIFVPEKINLAVIGPFKNNAKFKALLKI